MKILFYNHTGKVSGAERVLLMILQGLDRKQFEPVLLCPAEGPLQKLASQTGVECRAVPTLDARFTLRIDRLLKYLWSFLTVIAGLRKEIKSVAPELVHANSIRSGLVATTATFGLSTKVVWHLHDLLPRHPLSAIIRGFAFLFARAPMIAVSQAVADNFAWRFFSLRNRVKVILNGIDLERFVPSEKVRAEKRVELEVEADQFVVGIVGLLTPRKGQLELLQAFRKVVDRIPNAVLMIAGSAVFNRDGEYEQLLKQTVVQLKLERQVRFLGERDDVPELMHSFDALVVNSSIEPFGLVVVEGMAAMTPVIAARTGGIPEIIHDGRNGFLFPVRDTEKLAQAIMVVAGDSELSGRVVTEARRTVENQFSYERYLKDVQDFYLNQQSAAPVVQNADASDLRQPRMLAEQE